MANSRANSSINARAQTVDAPPRFWVALKIIFTFVLSACVLLFIAATRHWPFVGDETIIRYVNFLMSRGMAPYREIVDINMPGAYATDWFAVHIFGAGSTAWRLFDLSLLGAATVASVAIAQPYDWFAGIYCGFLLLLIHGRDGVAQTGQRDLTICVLVLSALALLFHGRRTNVSYWTLCFGLLCGMASTVKPTVLPLGFVLLFMLAFDMRHQQLPILRHMAAGLAGILTPLLLVAIFLLRNHAVGAFFFTVDRLIPYHASIGRLPLSYFAWHLFPSALFEIALIWLVTLAIRHERLRWERTALLVCLGFGLFSLVAQGKGYPYHRYLSEAFLLLLAGIDFTVAVRDRGLVRILGVAGLAFGVCFLAPVSTIQAAGYQWQNQEFRTMLGSDLEALGGNTLSGHIQCLDTASGCVGTLDHLQLEQATGFLYDCYLFARKHEPVQAEYRSRFWRTIQKNPPQVFVVTNEFCVNRPSNFERLERWPLFDEYLGANYSLYVQRTPPDPVRWWSHPAPAPSYRIYVRNCAKVPIGFKNANQQARIQSSSISSPPIRKAFWDRR